MDVIKEAKRVFDIEIDALKKTRDILDETYLEILNRIVACKGKVIITGMGKPGHISTKLAATFSSLGTPSFFLHPGEAMHGDLGMIGADDLVIAISYSGESDEIVCILPYIKMIGAFLIGITGNANSSLAKTADIVQVLPQFNEACYLGLAPTSSTTAVLCYGDSLAVVASGLYGFKDTDFGKYHPAGALGKKLVLRVQDLMITNKNNSEVLSGASLDDCIMELSVKGLGIVTVINSGRRLMGVITDGDLRRQLAKNVDIYSLSVDEVMTKTPIVVEDKALAVQALDIMRKKNVSALPVLANGAVVGTIRLQDIIRVGIIG